MTGIQGAGVGSYSETMHAGMLEEANEAGVQQKQG